MISRCFWFTAVASVLLQLFFYSLFFYFFFFKSTVSFFSFFSIPPLLPWAPLPLIPCSDGLNSWRRCVCFRCGSDLSWELVVRLGEKEDVGGGCRVCARGPAGEKNKTKRERGRNKRMAQDRRMRKEASIHFLQAICLTSVREPRSWPSCVVASNNFLQLSILSGRLLVSNFLKSEHTILNLETL